GLLGYLSLSDRRIMTMILGAEDLPPLPDESFDQRFGREEGRPQAPAFGDTGILLPLFAQTRDILIGKVAALDPEVLGSNLSFSLP
ncbi:hypothetical protein ACTHSL_13855, partial [Neisseria sp. P0008.S010]|uniref:hypothetical protein n=1 Tax=Neisseria sp. P0008.S010 TaxID=3436707 RepID=UPI003F816BDC